MLPAIPEEAGPVSTKSSLNFDASPWYKKFVVTTKETLCKPCSAKFFELSEESWLSW